MKLLDPKELIKAPKVEKTQAPQIDIPFRDEKLKAIFRKYYESTDPKTSKDKQTLLVGFGKSIAQNKTQITYEEKKIIFKEIASFKAANIGSDQRMNFVTDLFGKEKNNFIRELVLSSSDNNKDVLKNQLRNCFVTSEIMQSFGYDFTTSQNYFARKARIENYNPKNWQHVEAIRDWFLNKILDINQTTTGIKSFLNEKLQPILDKYTNNGDATIIDLSDSLSVLTLEQKQTLNNLSPERFDSFLKSLIDESNPVAKEVENKIGTKKEVSKSLGLCLVLSQKDATFNNLVQNVAKESKMEPIEVEKAVVVTDQEVDKAISEKNLIYTKGSPEWELFKQDIQTKKLFSFAKANNLSPQLIESIKTAQKQDDAYFYKIAQEYGFQDDLKNIWGNERYVQNQRYYKLLFEKEAKYLKEIGSEHQESRGELSKTVELSGALDEEWLKEIPGLTQKDVLNDFISDKKPVTKGKDNLKNNDDKKNNNQAQENEKLIEVEKHILKQTNNEVKSIFVERMIVFLQGSFNVSLDEKSKESLLSQIEISKNQHIENKKLIVTADYMGKKIDLQYDMQTGLLAYRPYLAKNDETQEAISISTPSKENDFKPFDPEIKGPYIEEIISVSEKIDCQKLLEKSKGKMEKYQKKFQRKLNFSYPPKLPNKNHKQSLKEVYLKNICAQEMTDLIGKNLPSSLSEEQNKDLYPWFKTIYENVYKGTGEYIIQNIQHLRTNIAKMADYVKTVSKNYGDNLTDVDGFEITPNLIIQRLFTQPKTKEESVLKAQMWNDFFDVLSEKKQEKEYIDMKNFDKLILGIQNTTKKEAFVDSMTDRLNHYFGKDYESLLEQAYV